MAVVSGVSVISPPRHVTCCPNGGMGSLLFSYILKGPLMAAIIFSSHFAKAVFEGCEARMIKDSGNLVFVIDPKVQINGEILPIKYLEWNKKRAYPYLFHSTYKDDVEFWDILFPYSDDEYANFMATLIIPGETIMTLNDSSRFLCRLCGWGKELFEVSWGKIPKTKTADLYLDPSNAESRKSRYSINESTIAMERLVCSQYTDKSDYK